MREQFEKVGDNIVEKICFRGRSEREQGELSRADGLEFRKTHLICL